MATIMAMTPKAIERPIITGTSIIGFVIGLQQAEQETANVPNPNDWISAIISANL
jgi:hypothetical protein